MNRYVCIHGHFYQPPRENPWLEEIELQESAHPYHDWNERITAESYAPNAYARILRPDGRIADIVNNFSRISFNVGPTLFQWLEHNQPDVYNRLLEADRESRDRFSGHGSAMAQAYNHLIMPLANSRDKRTQVVWGIADFEYRFGRRPEGMWLPETAVDLESLDIMAEQGIRFTVLSPHQAKQMRWSQSDHWMDVTGGRIDTQLAYRCNLPSGRSIAIFFYNGKISQEVAFTRLLSDGQRFVNRLLGAFPKISDRPRLVHIATDGETYGHHNLFADMALAWALQNIEDRDDVQLIDYAEFLEKVPPEHEVEIFENTSWSCAHGVERWRSDCGDNTGMHPGWHQKWRTPLRNALNWLRDELIPFYEQEAAGLLRSPWEARDDYISVILNREPERVRKFLEANAGHPLSPEETVQALRLLELQRHAMLMFTSCGWFFDEISGIETTQVMLYALRAMQIAQERTGLDLEPKFMQQLEEAPSNIPTYGNGARVFEALVKPARVDLHRVAAHYSIASLFGEYEDVQKIFCYTISRDISACYEAGAERLLVTKIRVRSDITWEEGAIDLAVVYLGSHNFFGGTRDHDTMPLFAMMRRDIRAPFLQGNIPETITRISKQFKNKNYSLWHLFHDEQRRIFEKVLEHAFDEVEFFFRLITSHHFPVIQAMRQMNLSLSPALSTPMEYITNTDLRRALENPEIDLRRVKDMAERFEEFSIQPDRSTLGFAARRKITALMAQLSENPEETDILRTLDSLFRILADLDLQPDLWEAQNLFLTMGKKHYSDHKRRAESGDASAGEWVESFLKVGNHFNMGEVSYEPASVVV